MRAVAYAQTDLTTFVLQNAIQSAKTVIAEAEQVALSQRDSLHQELGGQLLLAAGRRCLRAAQEVGDVALLIDAKDDAVAKWYASYGAQRLDAPLALPLPLATVKAALASTGKL